MSLFFHYVRTKLAETFISCVTINPFSERPKKEGKKPHACSAKEEEKKKKALRFLPRVHGFPFYPSFGMAHTAGNGGGGSLLGGFGVAWK